MVSDFGHPRMRGGGGGSKKGKFLRTSFMDGPLGTAYRSRIRKTRIRKTRIEGGIEGGIKN